MKRIKFIANLIKNTNTVVDIGCDHCYLAIYLLTNKIANKVINIDINQQPLQQGIANLKKRKLLEYTENFLNDGLKNIDLQDKIDYAVISGLGSHTIIDILKNNELKIANFIIQTNNKPEVLRKYLIYHFYQILKEYYIEDKKIIYVIFLVKRKCNFHFYSVASKYFGHPKLIEKNQNYLIFLNNRLKFLNKKITIKNVNNNLIKEHRLLEKRIFYYERKRDI